MMDSLCAAWDYRETDKTLHYLPLHHLHGVLNNLLCVLWSGGCVEFLSSASPESIFERLALENARVAASVSTGNAGDSASASLATVAQRQITMMFGVPTVYAKLLQHVREPKSARNNSSTGGEQVTTQHEMARMRSDILQSLPILRQMRIHSCGSSALPQPIMSQWQTLCGQILLERYGMTEIGMALSNPYQPVSKRLPGHVGMPLPYVRVRIVGGGSVSGDGVNQEEHVIWQTDGERSTDTTVVSGATANATASTGAETCTDLDDTAAGELRIKGPAVYAEYLNKPQHTVDSFDQEGWFCTGDIAVFNRKEQAYRILGRASTDVIKSAGYKISALEIEREMLSYPAIQDCAVIGVPCDILGQSLVAIVCLARPAASQAQEENALNQFLEPRLARYKRTFSKIIFADELPRNAMGKVNKKTILQDLKK